MKTHNLGFPRIGAQRELKRGLEKYWSRESSLEDLNAVSQAIRKKNRELQSFLDWVPVGDFSLYDQVLDMSVLLGNLPARAKELNGSPLDYYFRIARGRSVNDTEASGVQAGEMTKWFDTNYHYIVPEFSKNTAFELNPSSLLRQIKEARAENLNVKPVLIGPLTYLWLGKEKDSSDKWNLLDKLIPVYIELLNLLADLGVEWVQIDEPILSVDMDNGQRRLMKETYERLKSRKVKIMLATYFGELQDNLGCALSLPVEMLHMDAIRGGAEIETLVKQLPDSMGLSLGCIDGRNIWKTDLNRALDLLEPLARQLGDRLWLAPSCSLLHVPVDLEQEEEMDAEIKSWLAFAAQKLEEIRILSRAIAEGRHTVAAELEENRKAVESRRASSRVHNPAVLKRLKSVNGMQTNRNSSYTERIQLQRERLKLPVFPTTTIGSFPQTTEIRSTRRKFRKGELPQDEYIQRMQREIKHVVEIQEALGLDILVHGEPERNDMVEYFGEQLDGYVFSRFGWVQSYGSRCVKPPIIFGDISRPEPMTVQWSIYAQSITDKPMKGMLTGPVTILNWSFVRDDQPRSITCRQLALAMRDEVLDLETAGIKVIQIDEAALREGLPLRRSQWADYLKWAVNAFKITANGVADTTQIHTHMCYSEFNDIIEAIAEMDADVITIETSRSDMELLDVFDRFEYPNEIGPGVYDIHSPNVPSVESMIELMQKAALRVPAERLWINPDCGLKTRAWPETTAALKNMASVALKLRENLNQTRRKKNATVHSGKLPSVC